MALTAPQSLVGSWYGPGFENRLMANGHYFHQNDPTIAASLQFPFGTKLLLRNHLNGCEATVVIQDHGPYVEGRTLDVSRAAAKKLCYLRKGIAWLDIIPQRGHEELPAFWWEFIFRRVQGGVCVPRSPLDPNHPFRRVIFFYAPPEHT